MPPKGRKVKINMKEFIAEHGLSKEKPGNALQPPSEEEEWQDDTKSQNSQKSRPKPPSEQQNRKEENNPPFDPQRREQDEKSKPPANKKEPSFKGLVKQALNTITECRAKTTFPSQSLEEIQKSDPQMRMGECYQRLHSHYSKIFQIFKGTHPQAWKSCQRFSDKISRTLQEFKSVKAAEAKNLQVEQKDRYSANILRYYSMELKLKDDQIRRKRNFKQFARGKYGGQIKQIQDFINANSRLVSEVILRERFQSVVDRVNTENGVILQRKEQEYRGNMRYLFGEWRKMKKEKMMLDKIQRAERIQKAEQSRAVLAGKFPHFMGILLNPFNVYEGLV